MVIIIVMYRTIQTKKITGSICSVVVVYKNLC